MSHFLNISRTSVESLVFLTWPQRYVTFAWKDPNNIVEEINSRQAYYSNLLHTSADATELFGIAWDGCTMLQATPADYMNNLAIDIDGDKLNTFVLMAASNALHVRVLLHDHAAKCSMSTDQVADPDDALLPVLHLLHWQNGQHWQYSPMVNITAGTSDPAASSGARQRPESESTSNEPNAFWLAENDQDLPMLQRYLLDHHQ